MSIARDAQTSFQEALKYLEELERLGEFSKSQGNHSDVLLKIKH